MLWFLLACSVSEQHNKIINSDSFSPHPYLVPSWMAELPQIPSCELTYAYSVVFLDPENQNRHLVENGAINMAMNQHVLIEAGWADRQDGVLNRTGNFIKETQWQPRAKQLAKHLKILRQFRKDNWVVGLLAICEDEDLLKSAADQCNETLVPISTAEPPTWVQNKIDEAEFIYGIGSAGNHINAAMAWQEAVRRSRADLAYQLETQQKLLQRNSTNSFASRVETLSESCTKAELGHIQIIRHAHCLNDGSFYVKARMPLPE